VLNCALSNSLLLTNARLGNVQLMDWQSGCLTIAAQFGFRAEFLSFFRSVKAESGSACGRAVKERHSIIIEDVLTDPDFAPYRAMALKAGYRAVQSTPIISRSGAFFGVMSTHFPVIHRPTDGQMRELKALGESIADAIICQRIEAMMPGEAKANNLARQIELGYEALASSYELLERVGRRLVREQDR